MRSAQAPEQAFWGAVHWVVHLPDAHTCPTSQDAAQAPQFFGSFVRFAQPSEQFVNLAAHVVTQFPVAQVRVPFGASPQAFPHAPQFFVSFARLAQVMSHGESVPPQTKRQVEPVHSGVPPSGAEHDTPHAPQFASSAAVSTQEPSHSTRPSSHIEPESGELGRPAVPPVPEATPPVASGFVMPP